MGNTSNGNGLFESAAQLAAEIEQARLWGADDPAAPSEEFRRARAHTAQNSTRLLVAFVLASPEAAGARSAWLEALDPTGAAPAGVDPVSMPLAPAAACMLDGILAALLGRRAREFEGRPVASLATLWAREGDSLAGPALAAFLWSLARDPRVAIRPLEQKVVRSITLDRLLTPDCRPRRARARASRAVRGSLAGSR